MTWHIEKEGSLCGVTGIPDVSFLHLTQRFPPLRPTQKASASENRRFYSEEKSNKIKAPLKKKPPLRFNGIHCVFKFPRHC